MKNVNANAPEKQDADRQKVRAPSLSIPRDFLEEDVVVKLADQRGEGDEKNQGGARHKLLDREKPVRATAPCDGGSNDPNDSNTNAEDCQLPPRAIPAFAGELSDNGVEADPSPSNPKQHNSRPQPPRSGRDFVLERRHHCGEAIRLKGPRQLPEAARRGRAFHAGRTICGCVGGQAGRPGTSKHIGHLPGPSSGPRAATTEAW